MQSEFESGGKCIYCTEIVASHEIKKHLEKHLKDLEKQSKSVKNETFCHVEVVSNEMFLHLFR